MARSSAEPILVFSVVEANIIGYKQRVPFLIVIANEDRAEFSAEFDCATIQRVQLATVGDLNIGKMTIKFTHNIVGYSFDQSPNGYREELKITIRQLNKKTSKVYDLSGGRVFIVDCGEKGSSHVEHHKIEIFSPTAMHLNDPGREFSDTINRLYDWWHSAN